MTVALKLSSDENYAIQFNSAPNCDECEDYAQELRDFVSGLPGWKANGDVITFAGNANKTGLRLSVNSAAPAQLATKLVAAFEAASIPLIQEASYPYEKRFGRYNNCRKTLKMISYFDLSSRP